MSAHFGAAFVARDLGDGGPTAIAASTLALTHDRDLVTDAARAMMRRLAA